MREVILVILVFLSSLFFGHKLGYLLFDIFVPDLNFEYLKIDNLNGNIDDYFTNNLFLKKETFRILENLTNEEKVGMLLMPAFDSGFTKSDVKKWIDMYHIGGFIILKSEFEKEDILDLKEYGSKKLPIFISIDAEPSLVKYRFSGLDGIKNTSDINTQKESISQSEKIADFVKSFGVNLNFAPVYDNDFNKTVIGNRSFGGNNFNIQSLANSFSDTQKENGILSTAKHFPGHGQVFGDTHNNLQVIKENLVELDNFISAVKNNVPVIMVGHLAVDSKNEDIDTKGKPATLSKKIITNILIEDLSFKGIVITDAMNMGALDNFSNIEITSLKSGSDILLMTRDLELTYNLILEEMEKNLGFKESIDQKVAKIIRMKLVLRWLR